MQLETTRAGSGTGLGVNLLKTLGQCAFVWGLFLFLIPNLLMRVEMFASIPTFASDKWSVVAFLLILTCSTLFVISVWFIVWLGQGTAWPTDRGTHFVVAGPYRYMRNPMVIAGLGMGIASALILGSYLGLVYVGVGFVIWNFVLRPSEEANLAARFGEPYADYCRKVPAMWPTFIGYRAVIIECLTESDEELPTLDVDIQGLETSQ